VDCRGIERRHAISVPTFALVARAISKREAVDYFSTGLSCADWMGKALPYSGFTFIHQN
jgi:hypothetical protein